jgi:hypothetical protein
MRGSVSASASVRGRLRLPNRSRARSRHSLSLHQLRLKIDNENEYEYEDDWRQRAVLALPDFGEAKRGRFRSLFVAAKTDKHDNIFSPTGPLTLTLPQALPQTLPLVTGTDN